MNPIPIVIPLHHGGGKFKDDTELRFTLRSLERHFTEPFEVVIVGKRLPAWLQGVRHLPCNKGLKTALLTAAKAFPDGFFWTYDDCCLIRDTTAAEMKVSVACRTWRKARTTWARSLERIHQRLVKEGRPAWDFSRPHGPYWFDKGMIDEAFRDWPGMAGKFPFESWILSKRNWPRRHGVVKQYYGAFNSEPGAHHAFVNFNDRGNTITLRNWLRARFPDQSKFEATTEMSKKLVYAQQALHLFGSWEGAGSPPLRTICECAVGPWSLLAPFEGKCDRAIFVEPDPTMASEARKNYPWAEIHQVAIADKIGTANLRRLNGASYIKGIAWAPAFEACPGRARRAGKVAVSTVPFGKVDDGRIDLLNLDCEGSEWFVLKAMASRPFLIQIEIYDAHAHHREIIEWMDSNEYREVKRWGNANRIYQRKQ